MPAASAGLGDALLEKRDAAEDGRRSLRSKTLLPLTLAVTAAASVLLASLAADRPVGAFPVGESLDTALAAAGALGGAPPAAAGLGSLHLAVQVFCVLLALCFFALAANHVFAEERLVLAILVGGLGAACFFYGSLSFPVLFAKHTNFYRVPYTEASPTEVDIPFEQCGCAVFPGELILYPVTYNLLFIMVSYVINFLITLVVTKMKNCLEQVTPFELGIGQDAPIGDLILISMAMPSSISLVCFIFPSFLVQVYHYGSLVHLGWKVGGLLGFSATYLGWMNSGQVTFVVISTFGQFLADDAGTKRKNYYFEECVDEAPDDMSELQSASEADETLACESRKQTQLQLLGIWSRTAVARWLMGQSLLVLTLPAFVFLILGHIAWFWVSVPCEICFALLVMLFFPDRAADFINLLEDEDTRPVYKFTVVTMFPLLYPLAKLLPFYWQSECGTAPKKPNVWPSLEAFLISTITLMKVTLWQFTFNVSVMYLMGVGYWDVIPFSFATRHYECAPCLVAIKANDLMSGNPQLEKVFHQLWLQFASNF